MCFNTYKWLSSYRLNKYKNKTENEQKDRKDLYVFDLSCKYFNGNLNFSREAL